MELGVELFYCRSYFGTNFISVWIYRSKKKALKKAESNWYNFITLQLEIAFAAYYTAKANFTNVYYYCRCAHNILVVVYRLYCSLCRSWAFYILCHLCHYIQLSNFTYASFSIHRLFYPCAVKARLPQKIK